MPRYYEDKPEGGACAGVKEDLGACLLRSDCVLKEGKSPRQCLKEGNCKALKYSFFECKRSMRSTKMFGMETESLLFVKRKRSQVYRTFMTQEATRRT
uniref:Cytochrome c oxidase assembly factor 5 n=1 Tax=Equus caballus TaxID=9796 RepID=A0A9L0RYJ8_HORSE